MSIHYRHGHIRLALARKRSKAGRQTIVNDVKVLVILIQVIDWHCKRMLFGMLDSAGPVVHSIHLRPFGIDVVLCAVGAVELEIPVKDFIVAAEVLAQRVDNFRHANEWIDGFSDMNDLLAHECLIELRHSLGPVLEFKPFLHRQKQIGIFYSGGSHMRLLVNCVIKRRIGAVPVFTIRHDAILVARLFPANRNFVRLARKQCLTHRSELVELPLMHGLMGVGTKTRHLVVHELFLLRHAVNALSVPALHGRLATPEILLFS